MTVHRMGTLSEGKVIPTSEGGIHHRDGESAPSSASVSQISGGERISLSLLGDGYVEAIDGRDVKRKAEQQRQANLGIGGVIVSAPVLEVTDGALHKMQGGPLRLEEPAQQPDVLLRRFAAQRTRHAQPPLPGRISHARSSGDSPTPFDTPDAKTHKYRTGTLSR